MRRWMVMIAALLFGALMLAPVAAQDATPTASAGEPMTGAELGVNEMMIRYTDAGYEAPSEVVSGRYLVTFENASQTDAAVGFLALPAGWTIDDANARFDIIRASFGAEESGAAPGTPEAMAEMATPGTDPGTASPTADEDPFAWLYSATLAGGTGAGAGETSQVVVDLAPGEWAIWDDFFQAPAVALTVTGDPASPMPSASLSPTVTVIESDTPEGFAFEIQGALTAGRQIIEITNESSQPHFMELDLSPGPLTEEQLMQLLMLEPGTPVPADLPNPEEIEVVAYAAVQSSGTTQWLIVDLEPGTYIVACWIPDPTRGGAPHALEGMIEIVDVS